MSDERGDHFVSYFASSSSPYGSSLYLPLVFFLSPVNLASSCQSSPIPPQPFSVLPFKHLSSSQYHRWLLSAFFLMSSLDTPFHIPLQNLLMARSARFHLDEKSEKNGRLLAGSFLPETA
jgi:hypothetical protein